MSGGSCEGTAFQTFGYRTGALCIALGNYHNCAQDDRIETEYVSLSDLTDLVELCVAIAQDKGLAEDPLVGLFSLKQAHAAARRSSCRAQRVRRLRIHDRHNRLHQFRIAAAETINRL